MPSISSTPYDPLESVEGMFNCSVSRDCQLDRFGELNTDSSMLQLTWLAYYFKDRQNYGAHTVSVLKETSRRYQDALDDCEIQIVHFRVLLTSGRSYLTFSSLTQNGTSKIN